VVWSLLLKADSEGSTFISHAACAQSVRSSSEPSFPCACGALSILQRKRLVAPNFADLAELETQLLAFIAQWNQAAHPFNWTAASFEKVLAKVDAALRATAPTAADVNVHEVGTRLRGEQPEDDPT
jgi:hypothetical protein